jgi:hypothetical protein
MRWWCEVREELIGGIRSGNGKGGLVLSWLWLSQFLCVDNYNKYILLSHSQFISISFHVNWNCLPPTKARWVSAICHHSGEFYY